MTKNEGRPGQAGGGAEAQMGSLLPRPYSSTDVPTRQAPPGDQPAYLRGGLVYIGDRHVASVAGGELRRTFDPARELLHGGLSFRCDVLDLAEKAGARRIVATTRHTRRVYTIDMARFRRLAWHFDHCAFGAQLGLELERWTAQEPEAAQLALCLEVAP